MRRNLYVTLFASFLLGAALSSGATTQEAPAPEPRDAADVRIIVDISGSMKDTDPENLRQPAVRLLARMLPDGAEAGVWTFGQYVNMLVPHGAVNEDWRARAIGRSADINSVALRTNLGEAIEVASDDYFTDGDLGNTDFILLTDGKVDISDQAVANQQERARILGPVLDRLVSKNATIHTVALSDAADSKFLTTLADRTGGSHFVAPSADALSLAFLNALNAAAPQQQLPIEGNGFTVDSGVREFTALIFWGSGETRETRKLELTDPEGNTAVIGSPGTGMRWARESGYDLITVSEPLPGQWRIAGELGEGSRVTVVSDLRMVVSPLPPVFSDNQPLDLQIAFFEGEEKLTNPDFLRVLEVGVTVTSEDNRSGRKVLSDEEPPEDGIYSDSIGGLPAAGRYAIDVVADGQTFSRKFSGFSRFERPQGTGAAGSGDEATSAGPAAEEGDTGQEAPAVPAPEPEDPAEPADAPAAVDEAPVGGPIDIAAVERPAEVADSSSASATNEKDSAGMSLWVWIGSGALMILLIGGGLFAMYKRKQNTAAPEVDNAPDTTTESEDDKAPVVEPEPEPEPEPAADAESPDEPIPGADSEEPVPAAEPLEEVGDDEIPVADTKVDEELEDFGLEDFDLSEFDDLPESGDEEKARPEDDADQAKPKN